MDKFYLTDNIYLQDNKLFYEENNKIKNIKPNNWHTFLKDYGWEKLNLKWIKKLNSLTKLPPKNSRWGALDCGSDGDCLFHCICYALKSDTIMEDDNLDVSYLRNLVSENITNEKFTEIITIYKIF